MLLRVTKKKLLLASLLLAALFTIEIFLVASFKYRIDLLGAIALLFINIGMMILFYSFFVEFKLDRLDLPKNGRLRRSIVFNYNLNRWPEDTGLDKYLITYAKGQLNSMQEFKTNTLVMFIGGVLAALGLYLWFKFDIYYEFTFIIYLIMPSIRNLIVVQRRKNIAENYLASFDD